MTTAITVLSKMVCIVQIMIVMVTISLYVLTVVHIPSIDKVLTIAILCSIPLNMWNWIQILLSVIFSMDPTMALIMTQTELV